MHATKFLFAYAENAEEVVGVARDPGMLQGRHQAVKLLIQGDFLWEGVRFWRIVNRRRVIGRLGDEKNLYIKSCWFHWHYVIFAISLNLKRKLHVVQNKTN